MKEMFQPEFIEYKSQRGLINFENQALADRLEVPLYLGNLPQFKDSSRISPTTFTYGLNEPYLESLENQRDIGDFWQKKASLDKKVAFQRKGPSGFEKKRSPKNLGNQKYVMGGGRGIFLQNV